MATQYFPQIIPYRSGEKWGYTDRDKNILVETKYQQTFPFLGNVGKVKLDDQYGLIDRNGKEILPPIYEEIGSFATGTFLNSDGTCTVYQQDKCGLVSCYGDVLAEVAYDSEQEAMAAAEKKGWKGTVLPDFYPNIPAHTLKGIEAIKGFHQGIAPYKQGGKWGLISDTGDEVLHPMYDDIMPIENDTWPFQHQGRWGLLHLRGEVALKPNFDETRGFCNGQAACRDGDRWGAVDQTGQWMVAPIYEELGEYRCGMSAAQKDGAFGFVDEKGKVVLDFQYQDVMDFVNDRCGVFENEFIYYIDKQGKPTSPHYTRMYGPNAEGLIHVVEGDKWGLARPDGSLLIPIAYDLPKAMGQVLHHWEEGMIPIKNGPFIGFANAQGKEVIQPAYMVADPYCEGLSLVTSMHEQLNFGKTPETIEASGSISGVFNYGFIDHEGNEVVPLKYNIAHRFELGLAFVQDIDGRAGYVTYDGTEYFND